VIENRPIMAADPPRLKLKKLVKAVLGQERSLSALRHLAGLLERAHLPDRELRRFYRSLLGLHLSQGFRQAWTG
jgi:hypothetical protein